MQRRNFIKSAVTIAAASQVGLLAGQADTFSSGIKKPIQSVIKSPRAITMWDFSWLERRWDGAGYEDWDKVLDELTERGYNAVRIDAYPHLLAENPTKEYTLLPVWNTQMWGSPDINKVIIQPNLNTFISKCKDRDIKVGLSCWYRQDTDKVLMKIDGPEKMAENWIKTLDSIAKDGLLDAILYVDLCNEWPGDLWCPYFTNDPPEKTWGFWHTAKSLDFMKKSIELVKTAYPELPYCYSFTGGEPKLYAEVPLPFFDLLEHHTWLAQINGGEFDKAMGYTYERFSPESYKNMVANYEKAYNDRKTYWREQLSNEIKLVANSAKTAGLPLITTECWGIVDFKDWPLLKWDIIKELGELGVQTAASTGQWLAIASSNFAGPQFVGMWRDIEYHQKLTSLIRNSTVNKEIQNSKLAGRL
jgi:hypothetical protein